MLRCLVDRLKNGLLAVVMIAGLTGTAMAATVEKLSVVSNGTIIGTVVATTEGRQVTVDYAVSNNGRGPKHQEKIVLGDKGVPLSWTVQGNSLMGAPVTESYRWADGKAVWTSEPDEGAADAAGPKLYILNEDSPWALGVYTTALLQAPGQKLDVLPGGAMTLVKAKDATIGEGKVAVPLRIYRLEGYQILPDYVALDGRNRLFAVLKQSAGGMPELLTIRAGYEDQAPALRTILTDLKNEQVADLERKLAHKFDGPVRIVNVRVLDPDSGKVGEPTTVVVNRGHITRTVTIAGDEKLVPGETLIDGQGGTLIPGLADMHVHSSLTSGLLHIAAGVTTVRDMGNDNGFTADLVKRIEAGNVTGPHMVLNGLIEGKSPFSANNGFVVDSVEKAIEAARWYDERGFWQIKIYNSMNPAFVKPLAAEAHRIGMGVVGHVPAFTTGDAMIEAGYDEITHINQVMLQWLLKDGEDSRTPIRLMAMERAADLDLTSARVRRTVDLMKKHGTKTDPTAAVFEWLMLSRSGKMPPTDVVYYDHMPMGFRRSEKRTYVKLDTPEADARFHAGFDKMLATIKLLHDEGIQLLPGTDLANGFNLHRELILYVRAGLTPAQALKADTIDIARYFGREQISGSIERGKIADMVLLAADPSKDIQAITAPRMVMKAGKIYFPSEIYEALGIKPFSTPPKVTTAP